MEPRRALSTGKLRHVPAHASCSDGEDLGHRPAFLEDKRRRTTSHSSGLSDNAQKSFLKNKYIYIYIYIYILYMCIYIYISPQAEHLQTAEALGELEAQDEARTALSGIPLLASLVARCIVNWIQNPIASAS